MPIIPPGRAQAPFLPVERQQPVLRLFTEIEKAIKGWLFGCRMCGNCILQETMFICPMTCPKGLRNGLCGEASSSHCVVDENRKCTWYLVYERAEQLGRLEKLLEINAPVDGDRAGHESWLNFVQYWRKNEDRPNLTDWVANRERFSLQSERVLFSYRQPDWWRGDSDYHAPAYEEPVSRLEANLRVQSMITTVDIVPPESCDAKTITDKGSQLKNLVVSANFSDNAFSTSRMSSMACSKISLEAGLEPVLQIQGRDRTRVAIQSIALGASALGIRNILCLGGDFHNFGPVPKSIPDPFDLDAIQILWVLRRMRDEGIFLDGREMENRPEYFLGAAGSPFSAPHKYDAIRVEKKINAGAQFLQTQMIFDVPMFSEWLEALDKRGLLSKAPILANVLFMDDAEMARMMAGDPGIVIPEHFLKRMDVAAQKDNGGGKEHQLQAGIEIALEVIESVKKLTGVRGIHLLTEGNESILPRVLQNARLESPVIKVLT
jgi:methylenetetrahydrofolate reductase (NADPH)